MASTLAASALAELLLVATMVCLALAVRVVARHALAPGFEALHLETEGGVFAPRLIAHCDRIQPNGL